MILTLAFSAAGSANSAWFTRVWQTDDGLPNNEVATVAQTPDGYLWIGTAFGLARFDGIHFTTFPCPNSNTNADQGVNEIVPARAGGLWVRTRRGAMLRLSPDFSQATPAGKGLPDARALASFEDKDGCLWVAYPDLIWQVKNGQAAQFADYQNMPSSGYAGKFELDDEGNLWLAKGNGVYLLCNGRFELIASTTYHAHLAAARARGIWVAAGKQLFKCDTNGVMQDFGSFVPADIHAGTTALMEDHTGAVWIGTSTGGLFRHAEAGFERIETSHPDISSLAEDREGNIWVGTAGGGLDRVSIRSVQLEGLDAGSSLAAIQSICEDTNGVDWGATQSGLLVSRVGGRWNPALTNAPWTNAVDCVAADRNGTLWIGTRNSGLYRWRDGKFSHWSMDDGFGGHVVVGLLPASTGDLWIAEQAPNTLQCLHDGQLRSLKLPRNTGHLTALAEDKSGAIWAGSELGVLMKAEEDAMADDSALTKTSDRSILCLYPTPDGALWMGFEGAGLGRLKDGNFARIGTGQGLNENYISQMVGDDQGWFWFGSDHGIFKIRLDELESAMSGRASQVHPVNYGQNEGLFSMEAGSANISPYVAPVALRSRDGRLLFPMRKSLAVVDPAILRMDAKPPAALLSQVRADGKVIASYGGLADNGPAANLYNLRAPLELPPAHHHLEFDFTAIHFDAPENIHFRYQLAGIDSDWIDAGAERTASYSRLIEGSYEFRVETSLGDGPWSGKPTTLGFTVQPFFWQTWWFRLGTLFLFTAGVFAVARYISFQHLQAEMRRIAERAALDKERTRIARDLHDDLGCSLNKVALTLEMTQRDLEAAKPVNGEIEHCSQMVRHAVKSVDEIVWAINPRNDTLRYMVDYISQFAVEFLHAASVRCRVDLPENIPNWVVSPEARHNLFLVVKEALNNVTRHAQASEVRLRVTASDHDVAITITDNGCGFESAPDNASSDGLRNMRQRMDEIGGQFQLDTRPGAGTTVAFHYAWPVNQKK